MKKGSKAKAADQKIRTFNRAVDQATEAGNQKAADSFRESLHKARMARLSIKDDE